MANIKYRFTMTPEARTVSEIKGSPLTYEEVDTNFKLIDLDLDALKNGTGINDGAIASAKLTNTGVTAGTYGSSTTSPELVVNAKGQITSAIARTIAFPVESVSTGVYRTNTNITATIPLDDTVPQNTEGTQIIQVTMTPKSATNKLLIEVVGFGTLSSAGHIVYAVFRDSNASAVTAGASYCGVSNMSTPIVLSDEVTAGTTTSTTFYLRVGPDTSNTLRMNGSTAARYFGGSAGVTLKITEVRA